MAERKNSTIREILLRQGPRPPMSKKKRLAIIWGFILGHLFLAVFVLLLIVVVGAYALAGLGLAVAESPSFCTLCHNMQETYNSYLNSGHEGVKCGECHNEPGLRGFIKGEIIAPFKESYLYVTKNYKEHTGCPIVTHVKDESCLREECHKTKRLEEEVFYKKGIAFSHKGHLHWEKHEEKGIHVRCATCHATDIVRHMKVDPDQCFLCHFVEGSGIHLPQDCAACHWSVEILPAISYTHKNRGEKRCIDCHLIGESKPVVEKECCLKCHGAKSGYEGLEAESKVLHENHHYVRCRECHTGLRHKVVNIHSEEASCGDCHITQAAMVQGKDMGFGLGEMQSETFTDNHDECILCHKGFGEEYTREEMQEGCSECHEDEMAELADIEKHEKEIGEAVKKVKEDLETVGGLFKVKKPEGQDFENVVRWMEEARAALSLVGEDGSQSLHNKTLVKALLEKIEKNLKESLKLLRD